MNFFRIIALCEGLSYILLLFIAMPLKYFWHQEIYVQALGMAHGILFVIYVCVSIMLYRNKFWPRKEFVLILLASVIPFGTFYIDRKYLQK
jgi:integral membrane protein